MSVAVIIPAAGSGSRFGGDIPKQFRLLGGKPILQHVVERFLAHERVGNGVEDGVGVRVSGEAAGVADADAAEDEGARFVEGVHIDALPDADHDHCSSIRSAIARSSGRVILKFIASPGTRRTS